MSTIQEWCQQQHQEDDIVVVRGTKRPCIISRAAAGQLKQGRRQHRSTKSSTSSPPVRTLQSYFIQLTPKEKKRRVVEAEAGRDVDLSLSSQRGDLQLKRGQQQQHVSPSSDSSPWRQPTTNSANQRVDTSTPPDASSSPPPSQQQQTSTAAASSRITPTPPSRTSSSRPRSRTRQQQLYLDFGQSNFAKQIICPKCNMLYVHGLAEDAARHEAVCKDYKDGVTIGKWKHERTVRRFDGAERIVEVRPDDPASHRCTVDKVKSIVDQEMGFVANTSNNQPRRTTFLYVSGRNKIVGFCTAELVGVAYALLSPPQEDVDDVDAATAPSTSSSSFSLMRSQAPTKATFMGVHQIWTHNRHRSRGIARRLLDAARDSMVFGTRIPLDKVAFSSPTGDGVRLARSYVMGSGRSGAGGCNKGGGIGGVMVYDC